MNCLGFLWVKDLQKYVLDMWSLQVLCALASSDSRTCSVERAHKDASSMKNLQPHRRESDSGGGISRPLKSLSPGLRQLSVNHLGNKHMSILDQTFAKFLMVAQLSCCYLILLTCLFVLFPSIIYFPPLYSIFIIICLSMCKVQ